MATEITVNTSGNILSIAVDKTDYPSGIYPGYIDIAINNLSMNKGNAIANPLLVSNNIGSPLFFDTATGTINVGGVAATDNDDLRTKILALI